MLYDTNIVVSIAFVAFVILLAYFGVHRMLFRMLDDRAAKIRDEIDEARRLREEAQSMLASYERRQREVEDQAEAIVRKAHQEAEEAAEQAKAEIAASVERRLKAAEEQIAQAEQGAVRAVRNRAVQVAVSAAEDMLRARMDDDRAAAMVDSAIETVGQRLN